MSSYTKQTTVYEFAIRGVSFVNVDWLASLAQTLCPSTGLTFGVRRVGASHGTDNQVAVQFP